jgi:hypothetical protein|nr:MAG TPA: hypothetical protein [Caudoviricetes sp.]
MSNIKTNKDMKTSQDFNSNFEQYNEQIEMEIANLNRMRNEIQANGAVAQQIINDLEPVLAKLHLTIDSFTMNRPDKEKASNRGRLSLHLVSDGKFKFIQFRGYTSRGAGKNESRLDSKAEKICEAVMAALQNPVNELRCSVNPFSLEVRDGKETGRVLMDISYNF